MQFQISVSGIWNRQIKTRIEQTRKYLTLKPKIKHWAHIYIIHLIATAADQNVFTRARVVLVKIR